MSTVDSVTVTTTATEIVAPNSERQSLIIRNTSSGTVFLGKDDTVTTSNGTPLSRNEVLTETNDGTRLYMGSYYGIVSTGTSDVRVWERTV